MHHTPTMVEKTSANQRRSSRVFVRLPVALSGRNSRGRTFRSVSETIVINAHGGLMYINEPLEMNAMLVVSNPATQEDQECRVVYLGDSAEKGQRIGVEFLAPAPHFWGVDFAPADWPASPPSSAATP